MTHIDRDKLKADYDRDGFVIIRNFLSSNEVDELREHAVPIAREHVGEQAKPEKYKNLFKSLQDYDDWFDQSLRQGKQVELLRHLVGTDIVGATAAWFDRPPGEQVGLMPHVDAIGRYKSIDAGVTIWLPMDPSTVDNGCVYYLRGSHKNEYPDSIPIPGIDTDSDDAVAIELEPGDASIHNALTVHWSGGNTTGVPRRAVSYFYFGAETETARQQQYAL
ncbi:MAG: phytanoyl-CoA dioxygenase family protein [Woeseiaceae bacterium]